MQERLREMEDWIVKNEGTSGSVLKHSKLLKKNRERQRFKMFTRSEKTRTFCEEKRKVSLSHF